MMGRGLAKPLCWAALVTMALFVAILAAMPVSVKDSSLQVNTAEAATKTSVQSKMLQILYAGKGGYVSCDYDGYVHTRGRHEGIDFTKAKGASIYSLVDGVVTRVSNSSSLSTCAIWDSSNGKTVIYLHSQFAVRSGQHVTKGQYLGREWVNGTSSAHTHIEVRNGRQLYASKSVNDYTLSNPNPYSYWEKVMIGATTTTLSHPIEYNTNGGSGTYSNTNVKAGSKFTLPSAKPAKAGYVFKGWALKRLADQKWFSKKGWVSKEHVDQNGGYSLYNPGAQLTLDASWTYGYAGGATKFRFNAIWEKVSSKVYFGLNGGSGNFNTITSSYGSQFKMPAAKPTKSGYTFKGWALKRLADQKWITTKGTWVSSANVASNGGYRIYSAGTDRTLVPSWYTGCEGVHTNFRFYAQWEKVTSTQFKFSYNLNGGSGSLAAQTVNQNGTLTVSSTKPTRVGYKFVNWTVKREGDSLWYSKKGNWVAQNQLSSEGGNWTCAAGSSHSIGDSWTKGYTGTNHNYTFYAQWAPIAAKFTFGLNGGTGSFSTLNLKFGDKFSLPAAKPTKQYYTFKGWNVKRVSDGKWMSAKGGWVDYYSVPDNGGYKRYAPSAAHAVSASWITGYTKGDAEFRFYADYEKNAGVFEFTFGLNGGEGNNQSVACTSGGTITLPKPAPTKAGYTFKGWAAKRIGDSKWVSMKGWVASKEVASKGGYRYYPAGKTLTIDASWTKGYTGSVRDYRFFAQWEPTKNLKAA